MSRAAVIAAQENVLRAALRVLAGERDEEHAHKGDEIDYANELLALAARDLYQATEALPEAERPVGWKRARDASEALPNPSGGCA